jgi:hypothetical protein
LSLEDARRKIKVWREYYNKARPHSALQWMTPAEFARQCTDRVDSGRPEEPRANVSEAMIHIVMSGLLLRRIVDC